MPGMGLTAVGLAGVVLSYANIAHTFIDGMHALTGLTMFVGLIFLAAGILDGGVSTSNRAKSTTLVIISIVLGFGMFAFTMNTSNYSVTLAGILMAIAFPSIIIAYLAVKMPQFLKPIGSIVGMAAATGIIAWVAFGFVTPDTYMIPAAIEVPEEPEHIEPTGPIFTIKILEGSTEEGAPDYDPELARVPQGHVVEWINEDTVAHTVTSTEGFGEIFDSSLVSAGDTYTLDTNELEIGEYEYLCSVHPWMTAVFIIEEPKEATKIIIPDGAGIQQDGQVYYDPQVLDISSGTTVVWENVDSTIHTATSGKPGEGDTGIFDSGLIAAGDSYKFTFAETGSIDYYCVVHPWMIGTVNVE